MSSAQEDRGPMGIFSVVEYWNPDLLIRKEKIRKFGSLFKSSKAMSIKNKKDKNNIC